MASRKHGKNKHSHHEPSRKAESPQPIGARPETGASASAKSTKSSVVEAAKVEAAPDDLPVASIAALELMTNTLNTTKPKPASRLRGFFVGTFIAVGALSIVALNIVTWSSSTILNTDKYVQTVTPLVQNAAVQTAIQQYAYTQITAAVDINAEVAKVLPDNLKFLSAPIASQVDTYLNKAIGEIVKSPQFEKVWVTANTKAHEAALQTIKNSSKRQEVALNLADMYGDIRAKLLNTNLGPTIEPYLPTNEGAINLINASGSTMKTINSVIQNLPLIIGGLVVLALLMFGAAIAISPQRRRTVMWIGFGTAIAMALAIVATRVVRTLEINQITDPVYRSAALASWQIILRNLFVQSTAIIVVGLVVGFLALLTGPGPRAWYIRAWHGLLTAIHSMARAYPEQVAWLRVHERTIWIVGGVLVLLAGMVISLSMALIIVCVVALLLLFIRTLIATKARTTFKV